MANGVFTPQIPVSNDVVLGEFKAYKNYGLPSQLLLGATRGGAKLAIERKIKDINFDGAYGNQLDSNGVPLVRYETFVAKLSLESLYLKYFNRTIISNCETGWESEDWTLAGGAYAAESAIVAQGSYSAKLTASTDTHGIHEVFSAAKDLTAFTNTDASDTSDLIGYCLYIAAQDKTDLNAAGLRLIFHCDAEETLTNYFYKDIAAADLTAGYWNSFTTLKSGFTSTGSPNWNAITGISLVINGTPSDEVVCYIDDIQMLEAQTNSSPVNVNGSGFNYTTEELYREYKPTLEIADGDYLDNVTLVGARNDGKKVKIVLKNCLNDGNVELGFKEKDEVVSSTEWVSHYLNTAGTTTPFELYEEV